MIALVLNVNCGSSHSSSGSSSGSSSPSGSSAPSGGNSGGAEFAYAFNPSAKDIAAFKLDPGSGTLTMLPASPFVLPTAFSAAMAATPATAFVFVSDWMNRDILVFKADPASGNLSSVTTVAAPELQSPYVMRVDPSGRFLYVGDGFGMAVSGYAIGSSGSLTPVPGSPFAIGQPVSSLAIDGASHFLYAGGQNIVAGFTIGSDGSLTPVPGGELTVRPPFITPGKGPVSISAAIDPGAHFLFVGDTTAPQIFVYSIAGDGSLTQVSGSPFSTQGMFGGILAVHPSGKFVFDGGGPQVASFVVGSGGSLTPAPGSPFDNGPFRSGGAPVSQLVVDPSGNFLLTSNIENSNITVFRIDLSSGSLTNVSGSPFPVAAQPIGGGSPYNIAVTH